MKSNMYQTLLTTLVKTSFLCLRVLRIRVLDFDGCGCFVVWVLKRSVQNTKIYRWDTEVLGHLRPEEKSLPWSPVCFRLLSFSLSLLNPPPWRERETKKRKLSLTVLGSCRRIGNNVRNQGFFLWGQREDLDVHGLPYNSVSSWFSSSWS